MNRKQLRACLNREVDCWSRKPFDQIVAELPEPLHYESVHEGLVYRAEALILEQNDYVHVCVAVDDGGLLRFMFPLSTSFLVYRNGKVDKPMIRP